MDIKLYLSIHMYHLGRLEVLKIVNLENDIDDIEGFNKYLSVKFDKGIQWIDTIEAWQSYCSDKE